MLRIYKYFLFKSEADIAEFSKGNAFNDCIMDNEMAARRRVISDKCDRLAKLGVTTNKTSQGDNS